MASARTPYQDTSVPVERSKEQIRSALRSAAAGEMVQIRKLAEAMLRGRRRS